MEDTCVRVETPLDAYRKRGLLLFLFLVTHIHPSMTPRVGESEGDLDVFSALICCWKNTALVAFIWKKSGV